MGPPLPWGVADGARSRFHKGSSFLDGPPREVPRRAPVGLSAETAEDVRRVMPTACSHEFVSVIFEQPYCRIADLVIAGIAARQAAARYLTQLWAAGVLEERTVGREKLFIHGKRLRLLTRESNTFGDYRQASRKRPGRGVGGEFRSRQGVSADRVRVSGGVTVCRWRWAIGLTSGRRGR